jgi:hypothetical protein
VPTSVPSDLQLITEKLLRAREHLKVFEDEAGAYFKGCGAVMEIQVNPEMTKMALRFCIDHEPPARLSVLIGDCVHNARSALDNLICALARAKKSTSSCSGRQYPVSTDPVEYQNKRNVIMKGVPEQARLLIDKLNPASNSQGGIPASLHAVAILNTLSNRDKHRTPLLTAAYSRETEFRAVLPKGFWGIRLTGSLYANVNMEIPFQAGLVEHSDRVQSNSLMNLHFRDQAMFGDEPALSLLTFSLDFVEQTVVPSLKPFLNE